MNTRQKDKKYLGRGGAPRDLEIALTKGNYVYDRQGKKYVDFYVGWCVGNVGWDVPEIKKEIKKFNGPDYVSPGYFYAPWAELAEMLAKITPGKLTKSFRATGGTEAVEIALQAAMSHTKRHKFVSIEGSYHGHSIGAMSVGSTEFRGWYKNLLNHCNKIKPPLDAVAAKKIVKLLSQRDIAAVIMEPIVCNAGVLIPTKEFFQIVSRACKKYGTLLIDDEVATGFGRTGKMFGIEHYGVAPDIMCLAKGITDGFGALGATIMKPTVARSMEFPFSFYSTFGWQPLNVAATLANLKYFVKHKKQLLGNANKVGKYIVQRLNKMPFKYPAKIKAIGLTIAVSFSDKNYAGQIIKTALKKGLLLADAAGDDFVIFPALNISRATVKEGLDILEKCL